MEPEAQPSPNGEEIQTNQDLEPESHRATPQEPRPPEPEPRLAIQRLRLENFKSYGGVVDVGPFHKSFSSIVGPNGSGKSNVIDAMLFIFGRRAKQLRHTKLSELLHNSSTYPNVTSATVTVYFHEILDTGDRDDDYTVVSGSEFSVARRAFKNNTSKYFLNDTEVKMAEVVALLKSKGVDLDNNRFLILQGEVEQIAMMKPKAVSLHEDGLLEYLEDIIGSNRHIDKIESSAAQVEALNEERGHKLNRVKAAERERDSLESAKDDAVDYLDKERDLLTKKIKLSKARRHETAVSLRKHSEENKEAQARIDEFRVSVKEKEDALAELEKTFSETQRNADVAVKTMNDAKDKYTLFERKDIKLREDIKALKAKEKKLSATRERELKHAEENSEKAAEFLQEKTDAEARVAQVESALQNAQQKFDKVRDEVKEKTAPIREKLEKKQEELLPYSNSVNERLKELHVAQSELKLLVDKLEAPAKQLEEAERSLQEMELSLAKAKEALQALEIELRQTRKRAAEQSEYIERKRVRIRDISAACSEMRRKVEDARASREMANTRSALHKAILNASQTGHLPGIVGRLGDLASVDSKYGTAVGAAAGANLECIVVQTAENAQTAIQFLRKENLGRATFVILDKVEYLRDHIDGFSRSDRGKDGPRLFDYVDIPNPQHKTALYYALRDTLVAASLEEARRMAFKPSRLNRVVTISGELIESSGAMTGGGRGPTRYRLGSGRGGEGEIDPSAFKDLCGKLETSKLSVQVEESSLHAAEQGREESTSRIEQLEVQITRTKLEVSSLTDRVRYMARTTIPGLKCQVGDFRRTAQTPEAQRRRELEKIVSCSEASLANARAECEGFDAEIKQLQDKIFAAGGKKFQNAKSVLEDCRTELGDLKSTVSKASSRVSAAEKASRKAEEAAYSAEEQIATVKRERAAAREQSEAMLDDAEKVLEKFKEAEAVHEEWVKKVHAAQVEHSDVKDCLKKLRRKEVSLVEAADAVRRQVYQDTQELSALKKKEQAMSAKLTKLSLMSVDMPVGGDDEAEDQDQEDDQDMECAEEDLDGLDNHRLSSQERKQLSAEVSVLESQLADLTPNLGAISEYKSKDGEYRSQVAGLDSLTCKRDSARRECDSFRKARLDEFMAGFSVITLKLKELYQMITLGGDAELELVDSLDPFSEGILFSVRPPKKSWKNISNLSGGEKTLSSLALVFALHYFKPTPLYFLDEIDAALDYKNVSIVANYVKERTKNAQFIIISLRNNMFELADRLVGIYKTHNTTKSVTVDPSAFVVPTVQGTQVSTT